MATRVLALFTPATLCLSAAAAQLESQCSDDLGCSLAGQCVGGKCVCEPWTTGEDCSVLRLSPLSSAAELQSVVQPVGDTTRWGGSVAEESGKYLLCSNVLLITRADRPCIGFLYNTVLPLFCCSIKGRSHSLNE